MTTLEAGTVQTLQVAREAAFGYFLSDGHEDVLLHSREITEEFDSGQPQTVFLYQDHQGRLSATMTIPTVQMGVYDWAPVVEVRPRLGAFVSIGISKDILVSKDDLPELDSLWPVKGDRLYCTLKIDKKGRLFGELATEDVIRDIVTPATKEDFNKNITGTAYRLLKVGTFIVTEENFLGFVHESERKQEPRLGQKVDGRIIDIKEDGSVNVSLLGRTYEILGDDATNLYHYMEKHNGEMPYWDKSDPEDIKEMFGISKAAFKRALGKLMKEGKVLQQEGRTTIKKGE